MRFNVTAWTTFALFASAAFGQPPAELAVERVLHFTRSAPAQDLAEISTLIRSMAEIKELSVDPAEATISLRTTPAKIALAEWLLKELTQPPSAAKHEYRPEGGADDIVRVFFVSRTEQVRDVVEISVLIRTVGAIPKLFVYVPPRAIAVRGTEEQINLTEWLIGELDQPADRQDASVHEYKLPSGGENVVRVFYRPDTELAQLNKIATQIRIAAKIQRGFTNSRTKSIVVRGTPVQIAVAEQLARP